MLETVTTRSEVSNTLQKASTITTNFPKLVPGEMSPYPMVEKVTTVNHIDSKYESKESAPLDLKYGFSKMRIRYAAVNIVVL